MVESVTVNVALREPATCGVEATEMLHVELAASVAPQLVFWIVKSPGSAPAMVIANPLTVPVELFASVKVCALVAVPTGTLGNPADAGDNEMALAGLPNARIRIKRLRPCSATNKFPSASN